MTASPTPLPPGSMTVPMLFGWGEVALVVVLLLLVGAAAFVALAAGRSASGRSEFDAWLAGRAIPPSAPSPGKVRTATGQESATPSR